MPRQTEQRGPSQVGERQRRDDRSDWRSAPQVQRPGDTGRFGGNDTRQQTEIHSDRSGHRESRYAEQSREQYSGQYGGHDGGRTYQRYDQQYSGRRTQQFSGRVQRYERGDGGYRVWIDGADHCFWIPEARFLLWPLRIGLTVNFGGFWNPLGFYNVYDYGYYGGYGSPYSGRSYYGGGYYGGGYYGGGYGSGYYGSPYRGGSYHATSTLQGYVDRFDDVAGTFVVRDDRSGRYATVLMRADDPQFRYLQVGDWVSLSGSWTRSGYFEAYRIEDLSQR